MRAWPLMAEAAEAELEPARHDPNDLDFGRLDELLGALLERDWSGVEGFPDTATTGEAIAHYVVGLAEDDKELLLRAYLLLEVMLDEADKPGVANVVNDRLETLSQSIN